METDGLLTVEEASNLLQIKAMTLYTWALQGRIKSLKLGRCRRFRRSDIMRLIQEGMSGQGGAR